MKKFLVVLFTVFTVSAFFGHAPTGAEFNYEATSEGGVLTVNVLHNLKTSPVSDPTKHYLNKIVLYVKGKTVETLTLNKQNSIEGEKVVFKINLNPGDKISVKATCNLLGTKKVNYTIPKK